MVNPGERLLYGITKEREKWKYNEMLGLVRFVMGFETRQI